MSCPICKAKAAAAWRPFCSKRCADIDLGRWFTGSYRIPGEAAQEEAPEEAPPPPFRAR